MQSIIYPQARDILSVIGNTTASPSLIELDTGVSTLGWTSVILMNVGADVYGSLFVFQNGCVAVSGIPWINGLTGPACMAAIISIMSLFAVGTCAVTEGFAGIGIALRNGYLKQQHNDIIDNDYFTQNHLSNLTQWYYEFSYLNANITLTDSENARYYLINDSIIAMNATSQLWAGSTEIARIDHGYSTSRIHYKMYSTYDNTISLPRRVNEDGKRFGNEELKKWLGISKDNELESYMINA